MAKTRTLLDADNNKIYPVTSATVVYDKNGVAIQDALDNIPTKVSDLTNDSGFITKAVEGLTNYYKKTETYTQSEVNALISTIPKFAIKVVATLPTTEISTTTIYLVTSGTESQNLYTEYIYVDNNWEKLGTQSVDLTGYVKDTRKINNKALSADITLSASDVGALASSVTHLSGDVPTTRKVNGKALSADITLSASDIGALPSSTTIPDGQGTLYQATAPTSVAKGTVWLSSTTV